MPITLNHSNIGVQYSTGSNYIIETVKSDLYRRNENYDNIVRDNIQVAPVTPIISIQDGSNVYAVESYTYSGSANTADFTRVFTKSTTCDILIVGGGGGGGYHTGGGGGAGGYYYQKNVSIPVGNYTINVGKGGNAGPDNNTRGGNGSDTIFNGITAKGGGGGASDNAPSGNSGGSGGGADWNGTAGLDTDTNTEGNNGGTPINITGQYYGSGGGGAGSTGFTNGNGGVGKSNSITGANTFYAAGGGGGRNQGTNWRGIGGSGIGGNGGNETTAGTAGLNGTGSGGGGGGFITGGSAGSGGSGIVIIRYLLGTIPATNLLTNEPVVIAQTFTESIRSFTHSGGSENQTSHTITIGQNTICDILIVGGGGAGANFGGGGGAGQVLYTTNFTIGASSSISIKVGRGGIITQPLTVAENGFSSSITIGNITYTANGGGGGGGRDRSGYNSFRPIGGIGGSGGGGQAPDDGAGGPGGTTNKTTYPDWISNGNDGGNGVALHFGGGGGGAGAIGGDGVNGTSGGSGGTGVDLASIFTTTFGANGWFGGGGGGVAYGNGPGGAGGTGGGGAGARWSSPNIAIGVNGTANTGGGGGSSGLYSNYSYGTGGSGGSGIVLIKFKSIINAAILDGITHKRLNFYYSPNYPFIQADNTNLKAWYKFDGNYMDSSPSGYNLTNSGATIVDGLIAQSLSTDASDFLETSGINLNGKTYSISFWAKFNTAPSGTMLLFTQGVTDSTSTKLAFLYVDNKLRFIHYGGGNDMNTAGYNISSMVGTSWHHYVVTYNNTNRGAEIWLDGVKLNTDISTLATAFTGSGSFTIARSTSFAGTFNGLMEDFRYYDKILTSSEISQLYNIYNIPTTNQYTLNFPVPTLADINNNSNIVLRGAYDIALSTSNYVIIPKTGQYIPNPTTFVSDLLSIRYNILNPLNDPTGAQWAYNTSNMNVCRFGSVGIGTTNPEYTLDVSGSVNAKSYYLNGRQINEPLSELGLSEGMIAQVRHLTYTQMDIKNNTGWDAINDNLTTGFVIAITPKSNLSKILLNIIVHIGLAATNYSVWWGIKLYRKIGSSDWTEVTGPNGTETGSAAATAGTPVWISNTMYAGDQDYIYKVTNVTGTYLDSPNTTSTVYYTAYWNNRLGDNPSAINTIYLNRAESHGDAWRPAPSSSWTASEIWYG
jgi:hypothetical protein